MATSRRNRQATIADVNVKRDEVGPTSTSSAWRFGLRGVEGNVAGGGGDKGSGGGKEQKRCR